VAVLVRTLVLIIMITVTVVVQAMGSESVAGGELGGEWVVGN